MKIYVNTEEKHINLSLPNSLIINGASIHIIFAIIEKESEVKLSKDAKKKLSKLIKEAVKRYKGLTLVEVKTVKGEEVEVTL